MSGIATLILGEAPETDDDDENGNSDKRVTPARNDRNWNLEEAQQKSWSLHVDERLEERWRLLSTDTIKLAERQVSKPCKQLESLNKSIVNTQRTVQIISSKIRHVAEKLGRLESNLSLLQEGAKFIPHFTNRAFDTSFLQNKHE